MSKTATILPFRFYSISARNNFLKVVQEKGFEIVSENQSLLSAQTTGSHSSGIIDQNSLKVETSTYYRYAYDLSVKKLLLEGEKQYVVLLAEYFNFNIPLPGRKDFFAYTFLFGVGIMIVGSVSMNDFFASVPGMAVIVLAFILASIYWVFRFFRNMQKEKSMKNQYLQKLAPYLRDIDFNQLIG